jgi:UDP-glucose 4-epimerase
VIDLVKPAADRKNPGAKYRQFDIRDHGLAEIFEKEKPTTIFHLAAHINDRESVHEPVMNAQHNIIGSLNVFEAARRHLNGRLIFASTGVTYGEQKDLPISEEALPKPLTPYAVSKLAGERYLNFYHQVHGLSYAALRMGNVYGPRQDSSAESGAIGIFAKKLLLGQTPFLNNDGLTTRDYVYVSDVVEAFLRAANSNYVGAVNIATGVETKTKDIFSLVRAEVGTQAQPEIREEVADHPKHVALSIGRAKRELKWTPQVELLDGVKKTVAWFRSL